MNPLVGKCFKSVTNSREDVYRVLDVTEGDYLRVSWAGIVFGETASVCRSLYILKTQLPPNECTEAEYDATRAKIPQKLLDGYDALFGGGE